MKRTFDVIANQFSLKKKRKGSGGISSFVQDVPSNDAYGMNENDFGSSNGQDSSKQNSIFSRFNLVSPRNRKNKTLNKFTPNRKPDSGQLVGPISDQKTPKEGSAFGIWNTPNSKKMLNFDNIDASETKTNNESSDQNIFPKTPEFSSEFNSKIKESAFSNKPNKDNNFDLTSKGVLEGYDGLGSPRKLEYLLNGTPKKQICENSNHNEGHQKPFHLQLEKIKTEIMQDNDEDDNSMKASPLSPIVNGVLYEQPIQQPLQFNLPFPVSSTTNNEDKGMGNKTNSNQRRLNKVFSDFNEDIGNLSNRSCDNQSTIYPICSLYVTLLSASNLRATEIGFKTMSDPYVIVELLNSAMTQKKTSNIVRETLNPIWKQNFEFQLNPNQIGSQDRIRLKFSVRDFDNIFEHSNLGYVEVPLHEQVNQFKKLRYVAEINKGYKIQDGDGELYFSYSIKESSRVFKNIM